MNIQGKESLSKETTTTTPVDCQEDAFHLDPAVVDRFNLLNLHQSAPNSVAARRYRRLKRCRNCGSLKRTSTKKAAGVCNCSCKGPSDITCYQDLLNATELNDMNRVLNSQTTGNFKNFDNLPGSNSQVPPIAASIPPVPLPLFKSFSDPIFPDHQPIEFTTPPSSDQETPNSKKLRKFKQRMEDMRQWMEKVMQEEDEDTIHLQNNDIINNCKEQAESENEESVCVKKTEKGSILHFKCPCGGGYEVFLCGDKCFYRLT